MRRLGRALVAGACLFGGPAVGVELRVPADHATIQGAIDAAGVGDSVRVDAGLYEEHLTLAKNVPLHGAGSGEDGTHITGNSLTGLTVRARGDSAALPLDIGGLRISGFSVGLYTPAAMDIRLEDLVLTNCSRYGWCVGSATNVLMTNSQVVGCDEGVFVRSVDWPIGLTLVDSRMDNNREAGLYSQAGKGLSNNFESVTVRRCAFNGNRSKGMYLEKLHNALFEDIEVDGSGSDVPIWGAGVDINLKYRQDYANIVFTNARIVNCGVGSTNGVGLTIKARDDGSYSSLPAALTHVRVLGGFMAYNEVGIRFGEPGRLNVGPSDVRVGALSMMDNTSFDLINATAADIVATNVWWGTTSETAISGAIDDRADDPTKGEVSYTPFFTGNRLTVTVHGNGAVSNAPAGALHGPMADVRLVATPSVHWRFSTWSNAVSGRAASTNVVLSGDASVDAWFCVRLGTNGVPLGWLSAYGLGTNDTDALGDADDDGSQTWQEYYAGTDPTNEWSVLAISASRWASASDLAVAWHSVSGRVYDVKASPDLSAGDAGWGSVTGGVSATAPLNTVTVRVSEADVRFYRVYLAE